ncbi:MAG TPA: ABC transporter permease, partial [Longimicrobiales bacterium]|nr:ABC transporter permease [Longimicrobiales bacterium]
MEALFTDELARARAGGRWRLLRLACLALLAALRRGLYERSRLLRPGGWAVRADAHGREPGWGRGMDSLRQDLTFAVRSFARAPRFTAAVVVTLALGIGASSAVFSVLDTVVLRPLPFPDAGRFVHLAWDHGRGPTDALTPIQFEYWRENASSFEAVATYRSFLARVDDGDQVAGIPAMRVSADFLSAVGWSPVIGRGFTEEEDRAGGPAVVMVSHGLWERRFGGAPDVVGRSLRIGERPHVVVGVLPPDFSFPQVSRTPEVLVPLAMRVDPSDEGENWSAIARLRPDVSHEAAAADVGRLVAPFAVAYPNQVYGDGPGMSVTSFRTVHVGGGLTTALSVAMGAVGLVLLIACANVANLLLARATQRRREIALRAALGATRSRIVRVAVTEGVVLALASGALGLLVARWGVGAILSLSPVRLPRMGEIGLDWRVLGFAASAALVTGVVFGGVAALPALRARLAGTLKEGARGASASARGRQGLLVAQAALAMVLLVVSGLFIASLAKLARVDKGFDPEGVVAVRLPFSPPGYADTEARWELQRRFLEEVQEALPGVGAASASNLPLERGLNIPVSIGGRLDDFEGAVQWRSVSPGYFETLGIP